jgi:hypothetical protein
MAGTSPAMTNAGTLIKCCLVSLRVDGAARLIARGKAHNAAPIACARKLLIYAQRGTPENTGAI